MPDDTINNDRDDLLQSSGALSLYGRRIDKHTLYCRKRGHYIFGSAWLVTGDPFGLFQRRRKFTQENELIVYPKLFDIADSSLPYQEPVGETVSESHLIEDPNRIMGIRGYTPDTPFKHIHWKTSARTGCLQSECFEASTTLQTIIILDSDGFIQDNDFESAVSLAASLARHLINAGSPAGFYSNAAMAGKDRGEAFIRPGASNLHLMTILESLALVLPQSITPFKTFLESVTGSIGHGMSLCLISGCIADTTMCRLNRLQQSGLSITAYIPDSERVQPGTQIIWENINKTLGLTDSEKGPVMDTKGKVLR